jgi:hypothetical protein
MEELVPVSSTALSVTPALAQLIQEAIDGLPKPHRQPPLTNESFETPELALIRLQDWAFTQGFAVVIESRRSKRVIFECVHHHKRTRNSRKTSLEDRERLDTTTRTKGCIWGLYISQRKGTGDQWILGWTREEHNHDLNPDPFSYDQHKSRKKGYAKAVEQAKIHRGEASYITSAKLLQKEGLADLSRKDFYNLNRKQETGEQLTKYQELQLLQTYLESHSFHYQVRYEYLLDTTGVRTGKTVVKDIFFLNDEQIQLGRRFVSSFIYETDATFNTNELRLPLSIMIGITNTGATFPLAYCYITSESAKSFEFVAHQLTKYVFYDCPEAAVICADFTKGLGAAIAAKARQDAQAENSGEEEGDDRGALHPGELPDVSIVKVSSGEEKEGDEIIILQLCEWHAVEAIKRKLVHAGKYPKDKRDSIVDVIWLWVKAESEEAVNEEREKLLGLLHPTERVYLLSYYQPREQHFLRLYTRTYHNLGVHSTQRNEGYHPIAKRRLTKSLPLSKAIQYLVEDQKGLLAEHHRRLNHNRKFRPNLLDLSVFQEVADSLTHYCLAKAMVEWDITKSLRDRVLAGYEEEEKFDPTAGCLYLCQLPLRFGIPCRHWMYLSFSPSLENKNEGDIYRQLPLSLFHPRWYLDGPSVVRDPWRITWDESIYKPLPRVRKARAQDSDGAEEEVEGKEEEERSRFAGRGEEMVNHAARANFLKHCRSAMLRTSLSPSEILRKNSSLDNLQRRSGNKKYHPNFLPPYLSPIYGRLHEGRAGRER